MSYWDTSTLGKLYLAEADSAVFAEKAAHTAVIVTAKLTLHEMRRVVFRKESDGLIPANTAEILLDQLARDIAVGQIRLVDFTPLAETEFNSIMARCYRHTPPIPLRTFDAIHLASARAAGETELVAVDKRMREAAVLLGFTLFPA